MKRVVTVLLVICFLGGAVFAGGQQEKAKGEKEEAAEKTFKIKIAHIDPPSHPHNLACKEFESIVEDETDGNIQVEVYPAGQLGNAPNLMEQLQMGQIQIFQGGIGWWGSSMPDYWLVASNFVFDNLEHSRAVMKGEIGQNLAERLREKVGVRVLTQGMIRNPRNLATVEPVRSLDDLQGLKIRVPEMPNWMVPWEALGANPTPMPLTETYLGLKQGVVEGVEHGYPQLYLNNYTEVAKYVTNTRHQFEMAGFFIQEDFYQSLPDEYQEIVQQAAADAEKLNNEKQVEYKADAKEKMKEEHGVTFIDVDREPWYDVGRRIMQDKVVPELNITEGLLERIWDYDY